MLPKLSHNLLLIAPLLASWGWGYIYVRINQLDCAIGRFRLSIKISLFAPSFFTHSLTSVIP